MLYCKQDLDQITVATLGISEACPYFAASINSSFHAGLSQIMPVFDIANLPLAVSGWLVIEATFVT